MSEIILSAMTGSMVGFIVSILTIGICELCKACWPVVDRYFEDVYQTHQARRHLAYGIRP